MDTQYDSLSFFGDKFNFKSSDLKGPQHNLVLRWTLQVRPKRRLQPKRL